MWMVYFLLSFLRVLGGNLVLCLRYGADSRGLVEIRHAYSFLHSYLCCGEFSECLAELQKRIVVSALASVLCGQWCRFKQKTRNASCVSAQESALWGSSRGAAEKQIRNSCIGICVVGQLHGVARNYTDA
jgi:hypothetical protein